MSFINGKEDPLTERLQLIKAGQKEERAQLIKDYTPFIIKTLSDLLGRYIESENTDEYMIGMEAFNSALDKYEPCRGRFLSFARLVIRSRVIDYERRNRRHPQTLSINELEEDKKYLSDPCLQSDDFTNSLETKEQINLLRDKLREFHITFTDLAEHAPKHLDTRLNALRIARYISEREDIKEELLSRKCIPKSKVMKALKISSKVLSRSRKFIIAAVLILDSDLEILKDYISALEGGEKSGL